MLTSVIGVVVLLGGLIFFHEFGHYSIAKLFGVKVEVFSLGFGPKLFKKKWGETEYCLSLLPLGGYVKLMGDDPYKGVPAEEADRAFSTQKLYKRFSVVAAGPIANLLLAYVLFMLVFWFGQPMASSRLGSVSVGTQGWEAGLRSNDLITAVNGEPVKFWEDLENYFSNRKGETVKLTVERAGTDLQIPVTLSEVSSKNEYGEEIQVGGIKGISPNPVRPMVGISDENSAAYKAGLRSWDLVTKVGATSVARVEELNEALRAQWEEGSPVAITVERGELKSPKEHTFSLVFPEKPKEDAVSPLGVMTELGMFPSEIFVQQVTAGSAAEKGGLQPGDRIKQLGDVPVYGFETIVEQVQIWGARQQPVDVHIDRKGRALILSIQPKETTQTDPLTHREYKKYLLGFAPQKAISEAEMGKFKVRDPFALVAKAVHETNTLARTMLVSLGKLVVGQLSVKNLGGPVLIADVAGRSWAAGVIPFLQMMALISINLFLLNLFPIPILDGGHLLFFLIEGVKGKPVSLKTMEVANQIGMVFILMLVGLTLFNDISRYL